MMLKLATLCYLRTGGKTLMMHRIKRENDMHAGKWNGLGGKLLPGETPEACAIREVEEESGLTIHEPVLRGILTFPGFTGTQQPPTGSSTVAAHDSTSSTTVAAHDSTSSTTVAAHDSTGSTTVAAHDSNSDDWYTFVFVAETFTGTLTEGDEGILSWIDDDQLLALNLWPGDRIFLKWLDQDAFFSGRFVYVQEELVEHDVVFYRGAQRLPAHGIPTEAERPEADHQPIYQPKDDTYCWVCNGPVIKRHCKIVCQTCGFTRDCSDP